MSEEQTGHSMRRFPRMAAEHIVAYQAVTGELDDTKFSMTRTLGLGGLMFEAEDPLPVGGLYRLELVIGTTTLQIIGRVVYSRPTGKNGSEIGFEFTEIANGDREFLVEHYLQREHPGDQP